MKTKEQEIERQFIEKLVGLKYVYRDDIHDRNSLEANFRRKFEALNRVKLTDSESDRLLEEIVSPDVFESSERLRNRNTFEREDGTPLHYQLVNLKDWCKNSFEVVNQLRINTKSSYHRYDVILLINGLPLVQIELKSLHVSTRRAMQQIIDYRNDPGNGYRNSLLSFMQLYIVSACSQTWYSANNNNEHSAFNVDERDLLIYWWSDKDNKKIMHLDGYTETFIAKRTLAVIINCYYVHTNNEYDTKMIRPYQKSNLLFKYNDGQWYVAQTGHVQAGTIGSNALSCQLGHTEPFTNLVITTYAGLSYSKIRSSGFTRIRIGLHTLLKLQDNADCNGLPDSLIHTQTEKIKTLNQRKKSLMQPLLPPLDEVWR